MESLQALRRLERLPLLRFDFVFPGASPVLHAKQVIATFCQSRGG